MADVILALLKVSVWNVLPWVVGVLGREGRKRLTTSPDGGAAFVPAPDKSFTRQAPPRCGNRR